MKMRNTVLTISALVTVIGWTMASRCDAEPQPAPVTLQVSLSQNQVYPASNLRTQLLSAQATGQSGDRSTPAPDQSMPDMPGMKMGDTEKSPDNHAESGAMHSMQPGHHMNGPHMRMTAPRPVTPEDLARADQIAAALKVSIERYKDYRVALADGYKIFMPNVRQEQYHFTNYWNGFLEGFTFDPARPTSLLYKKTSGGYELVGAMYTAPRSATPDQLNERVPLSVASWHVHVNFCMPRRGAATHADWTKFGLMGSISTLQACSEANGKFYPQVFGWMVHVYPFEASRAKVWGQ